MEDEAKKPSFLRTHLWDCLLIVGLAGLTAGGFAVRSALTKADPGASFVAKAIYDNKVIWEKDLSTLGEEETFYTIQGKYTEIILGAKHNAIHVHESGCPGQECVHEGWVTTEYHPIICAYNGVFIQLESSDAGGTIVLG